MATRKRPAAKTQDLEEYARKRDFEKTPELPSAKAESHGKLMFCVERHDTTHDHGNLVGSAWTRDSSDSVRVLTIAPGTTNVGIFSEGHFWILDIDGNRQFNRNLPSEQWSIHPGLRWRWSIHQCGQDIQLGVGTVAGDVPIVRDWNGDGKTKATFFIGSIRERITGKAHELSGIDTKMKTNPDSPPSTPAALLPYCRDCRDLSEWPERWMGVEEDLPTGTRLVECFMPFLLHLGTVRK